MGEKCIIVNKRVELISRLCKKHSQRREEDVMDKEEFKTKFKEGMDKVVSSSKKAFGKAGKAVQGFSDRSVILIEKKQLESKREAELKKLGALSADRFLRGETSLVSDDEAVAPILEEIKRLDSEIKTREESLNAESKGDSEKSENDEPKSE